MVFLDASHHHLFRGAAARVGTEGVGAPGRPPRRGRDIRRHRAGPHGMLVGPIKTGRHRRAGGLHGLLRRPRCRGPADHDGRRPPRGDGPGDLQIPADGFSPSRGGRRARLRTVPDQRRSPAAAFPTSRSRCSPDPDPIPARPARPARPPGPLAGGSGRLGPARGHPGRRPSCPGVGRGGRGRDGRPPPGGSVVVSGRSVGGDRVLPAAVGSDRVRTAARTIGGRAPGPGPAARRGPANRRAPSRCQASIKSRMTRTDRGPEVRAGRRSGGLVGLDAAVAA